MYPTTSIFGKVVKFLHVHKFFAFGHIKIPGNSFIFVYFVKSKGEKCHKIFANYEDTCYLTTPDS